MRGAGKGLNFALGSKDLLSRSRSIGLAVCSPRQTREPWGFESGPYVVSWYEAQSLKRNFGYVAN